MKKLLQTKRKGEWLELTIPKSWSGFTIEYLLKEIWHVPRKLLHQYRMNKSVKVNGEVYNWSRKTEVGDRFQLHLFQKEEYGVKPKFFELDVLFEDDHLLIVNKPANVDTHPTEVSQTNTLANAVGFYFLMNGIEAKVRHIHRLDKETTGAIIFAKNALAGATMDRLLEKRMIKRTYIALVHGKLKNKKGTINEPIGRDRHHSSRRRISPSGQKAITLYEVLKYNSKLKISLVKLQLQTGRTHQIRVHMSHLGYPLVGDKLYGGDTTIASRQALHAAKISLPHPITNETIECFAQPLDQPPIFNGDILSLLNEGLSI